MRRSAPVEMLELALIVDAEDVGGMGGGDEPELAGV
jgi:hypothetical protein